MPLPFVRNVIASLALTAALAAAAWADAPSRYTPEDLQSDFESLYRTMQAAHFDLFAATPRSVLDQRHAELLRALTEPMTQAEAAVLFQTFLAEARHSHARIDFPVSEWFAWREQGGGALLLDIRIRDGRVWVEDHQTGVEALQRGDEILALNGEPNALWLKRMTRHLSAETPAMAYALLESYLPGVFWLEYPDAKEVALTVRHHDGREETLTLPLLSREETAATATIASPAFTLPEFDARMLDDGIGYLRPGAFSNAEPGESPWDPTRYIERVDAAFEDFLAQEARALIIDLRDNPGGSNSFSDPIIAWFADRPWRFASDFRIRISEATTGSNQARLDGLPDSANSDSARYAELFARSENGETISFDLPRAEPRSGKRFEAPVYVLINRYSYSNAVGVAAIVQDYGFAVVAGETTTDMATTYGAMESFTLPITGITVGYPKAHIIRPNGDTHPHPAEPDLPLDFPTLRGPEDIVLEQLRWHVAGGLTSS